VTDNSTIYLKLGQRIAHLRKSRGLNQEQFAAAAGIDRAFISRIENGKRRPYLETLVKIADALETPLFNLFRFDDIQPKRLR
jgi:transcriptional regulator with XRE-family HTH domain